MRRRCTEGPEGIKTQSFFYRSDLLFEEWGTELVLVEVDAYALEQLSPIQIRDILLTNDSMLIPQSETNEITTAKKPFLESPVVEQQDSSILVDESASETTQFGSHSSLAESHPKLAEEFPVFCNGTLDRECELMEMVNLKFTIGGANLEKARSLLDSVALWSDEHRHMVIFLCPKEALEKKQSLRPLLGASLGLTATPGEVEVGWAFSNVTNMVGGAAVESIFINRVIAEGLFLEDLRIIRVGAKHLPKSDKANRFVSMLCKNMLWFPRTMARSFFEVQEAVRHYNFVGEGVGVISHTPYGCRCKQKVTSGDRNLAVWSFYSVTVGQFERAVRKVGCDVDSMNIKNSVERVTTELNKKIGYPAGRIAHNNQS